MRTEEEIRRHAEALRTLINKPCHCAATGHVAECEQGGRMMMAAAAALEWALGDRSHDGMVAELVADAEAYRRRGGGS